MTIPKAGNLNEVDNYRGIALSTVALKVTNKMILNIIQPFINPLLRNNQNLFRPGRSKTTHILAPRRLIEGIKSHNMKAIITFVDFRKAFYSINIIRTFKILFVYGTPKAIIYMISVLHAYTCAKVITPYGETKEFQISKGVLQGDTLAPFLFVIVLDYAMSMSIKDNEV